MKKMNWHQIYRMFLVVFVMGLLSACQPPIAAPDQPFDYDQAVENETARWQAMADFYARHGLLNERFDYEQAADNQAARWQAMADFYARHGMLNERFDYEQAADNQAARWQAMARFYEKMGMLSSNDITMAPVSTTE